MRSSIEQWNWARLGIWSRGWEDPLEKGIVTHSSILAWITATIMKLKLSIPVSCYYWGTKIGLGSDHSVTFGLARKFLDMASISVLHFFSFPSTFSSLCFPFNLSCSELAQRETETQIHTSTAKWLRLLNFINIHRTSLFPSLSHFLG